MPEHPSIVIVYRDYEIRPVKHSLMEFVADKDQLKVYKREAGIVSPATRATVNQDREVTLNSALILSKFCEKEGDDLYDWTRYRKESHAPLCFKVGSRL